MRGTYNRFADQTTCLGMNNFGSDRNVGCTSGSSFSIRLDCDKGTVCGGEGAQQKLRILISTLIGRSCN